MVKRWRGDLCLLDVYTTEQVERIIEAATWRDLPVTLRLQTEDFGGHYGVQPVGSIRTIEMIGNRVFATGTFSESEGGQLAALWLDEETLRGVSIDPSGAEIVVERVDPETGEVVSEEQIIGAYEQAEALWMDGNEAGAQELMVWIESLGWRERWVTVEIGAATLCAMQAFEGAVLETYVDEALDAEEADNEPETVTASGGVYVDALDPALRFSIPQRAGASVPSLADFRELVEMPDVWTAAGPHRFPVDSFRKRALSEPTPFSIDDDGAFFGHVFTWGACHRSYPGRCRTPESMQSTDMNFGDFHTGSVVLDDGTKIRTGVIAFAGLHAPAHRSGASAEEVRRVIEENTDAQLGPVRLYADEFGVQACGHVFPDVEPAQAARALAGYPSGDWRRVSGTFRLFGLSMVNKPGYPVITAEGEDLRFVASMARTTPGVFVDPGVEHDHEGGDAAACGCQTGAAPMSVASRVSLADHDMIMAGHAPS